MKNVTKVERNFDLEAKELIKGLSFGQLYDLYEIVSHKMKQHNTVERDKELKAVRNAIEKVENIDKFRLQRIWEGYSSEMSSTANPKDGYSKPNRRRV